VCVCNKYIQIFIEKQYSLYFMLLTIHLHHLLCTVGIRCDRVTIFLSVFDKWVNISDGREWTFKCYTFPLVCSLFLCVMLTWSELSQTRSATAEINLIRAV